MTFVARKFEDNARRAALPARSAAIHPLALEAYKGGIICGWASASIRRSWDADRVLDGLGERVLILAVLFLFATCTYGAYLPFGERETAGLWITSFRLTRLLVRHEPRTVRASALTAVAGRRVPCRK
jgi:hypothetical protein